MNNGQIPLPNPKNRWPAQRYVMFLMESPSNDQFPYEKFANYFNWTMTYRRDSDFHRPYGWVAPKNWTWHYAASGKPDTDWSQFVIPKSLQLKNVTNKKPIAWMVSNCHTKSQREKYVQELSKHIQVDVYGHCGTHQCPDDSKCSEFIQDNYMFYLSFENSVCQDYVTEKFWTYLSGKLIPIVLGGADYKKVSPPHSYINALDYPNPKELAGHLNYLLSNVTAYSEYFEWVPYFNVYGTEDANYAHTMCQLCEALNNQSSTSSHSYENIHDWWRIQGKCQTRFPWGVNSIVQHFESWKDVLWESASSVLSG